MKIGIMADIHSNIVALNAVLDLFNSLGCEELLCCGDIIGIGPFPEETVQKIIELKNISCVVGNHDKYLIDGIESLPDNMSVGEAEHHKWGQSVISNKSKQYLSQLPDKLEIERDGIRLVIMHYPINEENKYMDLTANPSQGDCKKMFSNINADIVLYGHDHRGSVVLDGSKAYINCSSLGCPENGAGVAKCGILTIEKGVFIYREEVAQYNLQEVIDRIDYLRYPDHELIKKCFYGL